MKRVYLGMRPTPANEVSLFKFKDAGVLRIGRLPHPRPYERGKRLCTARRWTEDQHPANGCRVECWPTDERTSKKVARAHPRRSSLLRAASTSWSSGRRSPGPRTSSRWRSELGDQGRPPGHPQGRRLYPRRGACDQGNAANELLAGATIKWTPWPDVRQKLRGAGQTSREAANHLFGHISEECLVNTLNDVVSVCPNTDTVLDHKLRELSTVY